MAHPLSRRSLLGLGGLAAVGAAATGGRAGLAGAAQGRVREHWIAARNARWPVVLHAHDEVLGHHARKATIDALVYVPCTPGWKRPLRPGGIGDGAGVPGPVLRAHPGDTLRVHFRNEDRRFRREHTVHAHGVSYGPEHDGTWLGRGTPPGGRVRPGESHTYEWLVFEDSVGVWPYHDHGRFEAESTERGLFGALVVTPRDEPRPDVEHTLVMHHLGPDVLRQDRTLACFNGRAGVASTPRPRARAGQRVAFNVLAVGSEWHTFHVHGHRWPGATGRPEDAVLLGAAQGARLAWEEDAPGRWLYHCHVQHHMHAGMVGLYEVGRPA